jgi:hypothetical protein
MTEALFQFIWQHRLFDPHRPLITQHGELLQVEFPGMLNTQSGPDFLNAKIRIDKTLWVGHVELHVRSSDWHRHKHALDRAYDHLILHVVYRHDALHQQPNCALLELRHHIQPDLLKRYEGLMHHSGIIPCSGLIHTIKPMQWQQQYDRMLAERLEQKGEQMRYYRDRFKNDWHDVFHVALARGFGLSTNQDPFEAVAMLTPRHIIQRHRTYLIQLEALAFGQAGFLEQITEEEYPRLLQTEYKHLKTMHQLEGIEAHRWKFLRMRPAGFPTLRLAEWAHWLHAHPEGFTPLLELQQLPEVMHYFQSHVSDYWTQHYRFGERSVPEKKSTGDHFLHSLIINVVVPFLFTYGQCMGCEEQGEKALHWMHQLPPEDNRIIRLWKEHRVPLRSAADSQALLQLRQDYCVKKQCLHCHIGYRILRSQ